MKKLAFLRILTIILLSGCEREYQYDVLDVTPPELHVIVSDNNNCRIEDVRVVIYNNPDSLELSAKGIATGFTGHDGIAVFSRQHLISPGRFYVHASKGSLTNDQSNKVTPYMLLNDGHTKFYTVIE